MSLFDYRQSLKIEAEDFSFYAMVMGLYRRADTENQRLIERAWPDTVAELRARYNARDGLLAGETAPEELRVPDPDPDGDLL